MKEIISMKSKDTEQDPHLEIFGEDHQEKHYHHHHDSGGVVWGVMLLLAGIMLLLNTVGVVSWQAWDYIWQFWPVLLIFMGVHAILGNNVLSKLVLFVASVIVFGLIFIASLEAVGSPLAGQIHLPQLLTEWLIMIRRVKP